MYPDKGKVVDLWEGLKVAVGFSISLSSGKNALIVKAQSINHKDANYSEWLFAYPVWII